MKAILDEMLAALSRGERVVLCSILASSGSVPRGAGAKMAVFEDGHVLGTIGGGAVERLSIQRAQDALKNGGSNELKSYNLHPSEVASTGMICGGAVTVYFQFFAPEQTADVTVLKRWREMLDRDVDLWLLLSLDGDGVNEFHVVTREEIPQDKADYFSTKAVWKNGIYVEPLCHAGSVYIFGGGHVGRALVPVLATVGFRVVMYDNREELAKKENYPMASEVIFGSFSDISGKVVLTANDYAVVMTPGHQADYEILSQVLKSSATYIGCIGSRTKVAKTRERLKGDGYTEEDIARVHAPIGLPILAETPEEIAISIAAEMIEHRARLAGQRH